MSRIALRTSIAPNFPKLGFIFSNFGFLFQNFGFFGPGVGESGSRGFFPCQISRCGFLSLKLGFLRSGIWEFGAMETMI